MKRTVKVTLLATGALTALAVLGFVVLITGEYLALAGYWPFTPLERRKYDIALPNGAEVRIEAIEQRGFRSDGWTVYASYVQAGMSEPERIGSWEGYRHEPPVYVVKDLVVLPSPDQKTLYVRTQRGEWKFFAMQFPLDRHAFPTSHYAALTGLTDEEVTQIAREIAPEQSGHTPYVALEAFLPDSMEARVAFYSTNPNAAGHVRLRLSSDGTRMTLIEIKPEKTG